MVVYEGCDLQLLPWQEPAVTTKVDIDLDETISEQSENDTSESNETVTGKEHRSSEGEGTKSRAIYKDEIIERTIKVNGSEDDDDTKYSNSKDDLLEDDILENKEYTVAHVT